MKQAKNHSKTMLSILSNPRYRGKHIILIEGKVHTAHTGKQANQILDRLEKKYPHATPAITYIPKTDTLFRNHLSPFGSSFSIFQTKKSLV